MTEEPDAIGPEGTMKYFQDIDVNLEDLDVLAAHEIVQATAMAELSREGFVNGWQERKYVLLSIFSSFPLANSFELRYYRQAKRLH